jgi:hypothetical protein
VAQDDVSPRPTDPTSPAGFPRPSAEELALRRRVSDQEREDVAEILREAAGEGRLTYTELEDRLEAVYAAKTYGELVELTADLPQGLRGPEGSQLPVPQGGAQFAPVINAFMSEAKRTGGWLAPQRQEVNAVLGDVTLDYTEAQLPYDEVFVEVRSILADVKIRVPQNAIVRLDGNPILGSISEQSGSFSATADPGTARPKVFHIKGTAILGEIKVKRGPRLSKRLGLT